MKFDILTLFPEMFTGYLSESILCRAREKGLLEVALHNWREQTKDKHHQVDDKPFGGGAGMLLMVEPLYRQLQILLALPQQRDQKTRVIMLSPSGQQFNHQEAVRLSQYERLVLLAGRYEGFDARVEEFIDEKISIGSYVLAGGELPALVVLEAVARQIPGVLGHEEALQDETFSHGEEYAEYPQYTRPEVFITAEGRKLKTPAVLLSGNHKKIEEWRKNQGKGV